MQRIGTVQKTLSRPSGPVEGGRVSREKSDLPAINTFLRRFLDYSLHKITGVDRGEFQYKVEPERLSGKLLADLWYITIEEIFPPRASRIFG